ncbi:MAG: hypothetical protein JKY88_00660 [Pseudomonadales bacterium]|nr:hypothetical protein [Pseudomonadales bacterium]
MLNLAIVGQVEPAPTVKKITEDIESNFRPYLKKALAKNRKLLGTSPLVFTNTFENPIESHFNNFPMKYFETVTEPTSYGSTLIATAWSERIRDTSQIYRLNYRLSNACENSALLKPANLQLAAKQIEDHASESKRHMLQSLNSRSWRYLQKHASALLNASLLSFTSTKQSWFERYKTKKVIRILNNVDLNQGLCSREVWLNLADPAWLSHIYKLMNAHGRAGNAIILEIETEYGKIIFGGKADKRISANDILFIASLGGNNHYNNSSSSLFTGIPQLIVDFSGDDVYQSSHIGGIASGIGRVAVAIDYSGNDIYLGDQLSQGAGLVGHGILIDLEGDDAYNARLMSQGFAHYGTGEILDIAGNDTFKSRGLSQGVGLSNGLGILQDLSGDDVFIAQGFTPTSYGTPGISDAWSQGVGAGIRPYARGGIGLLIDHHGRDQYQSTSFSQGGGYFFGTGALIDLGKQSDSYIGARYQLGWAAHAGLGFFIEQGGADDYRSLGSANAGAAWDHSIATFFDLSGNNHYQLGEFSFGSTAHGSMSIFSDHSKNNQFKSIKNTESRKGAPNLSILLKADAQGNEVENLCRLEEGSKYTLTINITDQVFSSVKALLDQQCKRAVSADSRLSK